MVDLAAGLVAGVLVLMLVMVVAHKVEESTPVTMEKVGRACFLCLLDQTFNMAVVESLTMSLMTDLKAEAEAPPVAAARAVAVAMVGGIALFRRGYPLDMQVLIAGTMVAVEVGATVTVLAVVLIVMGWELGRHHVWVHHRQGGCNRR